MDKINLYEINKYTVIFFSSVPSAPTSSEDEAVDMSRPKGFISEDPALWPSVRGHTELCQMVTKGPPIQVKDIHFPQNTDKPPRRFTKDNYDIVMKNGEKINRTWLLYSVSTDSVFCYGCKLFGKQDNALTKGGFRNWRNLVSHLKEHEYSKTHLNNMTSWRELQTRLKTKTAIDQINQDLMQLEVVHWRGVIHRLVAIICFLAERNHALRGHRDVLFDPHNGNFLGLVELIAQ